MAEPPNVRADERRALQWLADQVAAGHAGDLDLEEFATQLFGAPDEPSPTARLHDVLSGRYHDDEMVRLAAGREIYSPSTLGESLLAAGRPALGGALAAGRRSAFSRVYNACLWAIFKLGGGDVNELIGETLLDSEPGARLEIVRILGFLGDRRAAPLLIESLDGERLAVVRSCILWALGTLADPVGLQACIGALEDDDAEVRGYAAWALGQIADPAALPALQRALDDPDDEVRHWVADAITSQIQMPS